MTAPSLATTLPVSFSAPTVEAQLRLRFLATPHNPWPTGGSLSLLSSEKTGAQELVAKATTTHDTTFVTAVPECPPSISLVLESGGVRVLVLGLEITHLGDHSQPRVDVRVTAEGLSSEGAKELSLDARAYAWRLSGQGTYTDDGAGLRLVFDLAQELEPTNHVDVPTSVQLPLAAADDGPQAARAARIIKIKPSGAGPVATQ